MVRFQVYAQCERTRLAEIMVENNKKSYWHDSLIVFGRMSGWVTGPIIVGLILGKWLDGRFGTTPFLFITSITLSFFCSIFGIVKEAKRYMKAIDKEAGEKKKQDESNNNINN